MPRNRSVSPQKMPSNQSTGGEDKSGQLSPREKDRLLKEIQEMFSGSVDPEVVHLVLTECEWRVDEAIETIFSMVPVEESGGESNQGDLQIIACALIGDAEEDNNTKKSVSMTTSTSDTKTRDKDMTSSIVTSLSSDKTRYSDKDMHGKEFLNRLSDFEQTTGECAENTYDSFQSYMTMSKIYGEYTPEVIGAMTLGDETMSSNYVTCSGENNPSSGSSVSGITDINLADKLNIVTHSDTAVSAGGKKGTCCPDHGCANDGGEVHETNDTHQSEMSSNSEDLERSEILKDDATTWASQSENTTKGNNSGNDMSTKNEVCCSVEDDFSVTEDNSQMCPSVSAMFSAFKSVQDQLGQSTNKSNPTERLGQSTNKSNPTERPDLDKIPPQFNLDAPAFVPRFSVPPPSGPPPPGYDFPPWSNPAPGPLPTFFTPKGPMHRPRGPPGPSLGPRPRFDPFFHPRYRPRQNAPSGQPRPLQPLFALSPEGQFKGGHSGMTSVPPVSGAEEISESFSSQTRQLSGMSYSEKASREPKLVPGWMKTDGEQIGAMATETSCSEHVKKVKSYIDKGRLLMVLMRGLPGSGKSFLAREIVFDGVVLSTDDYFYRCGEYNYKQDLLTEAHTWNKARARNAMDERVNPVIIDNTNTMEWEMIPYVRLAMSRGYVIQLMEPDTPWRFQPKILCKKNNHGVSKDVIRKMNLRYQHNASVSSMIAAVNKQQGMLDTKKGQGQAPVMEAPADHNSNIKLVEYEASSDEDEEERAELPKSVENRKTPAPIKTLFQQQKSEIFNTDLKTNSKPPAPIQTLPRQEKQNSGKTGLNKKLPPPILPLLSKIKHDKVEAPSESNKNGNTTNKNKSGKKSISQPSTTDCNTPVIPKLKREKTDRSLSPNSNRNPANNNGNGGSSNSSNNSNKSRNSSSSSNNSVSNSPRKRRRKKRRPSSSKLEVMQAIEEILNCCEEGEITPVDLKTREEEIEALLFMSHISDDDKKEVEVWLKEKLDRLKNRGKDENGDVCRTEGKRESCIVDGESEMAEEDDDVPPGVKVDIEEVFQRTLEEKFDEDFISELDSIVSSDFSKILESAKSAFTRECGSLAENEISECGSLAEEEISDVLDEISKLNQDKGPEVSMEGRDEDDEDDPWVQGRPKPRRNRRRRISQEDKEEGTKSEETGDQTWQTLECSKEQDVEVDQTGADGQYDTVPGKQTSKSDGQLEKELQYWNGPVESDVQKPSFEKEVEVISEKNEKITSWEDPKPKRERINSDRSNSSRSENELKSAGEIHHLLEETVSVVECHVSKIIDSEQLLGSDDVTVAMTTDKGMSSTSVENTSAIHKSQDDQDAERVGSGEVELLKDEINSEDNRNPEDEEEFKSCDSDSESEEKVDDDDLKQNPEDSFRSVVSSKDGSTESEYSNLSFLSDVGDESMERFLDKSETIDPITDVKEDIEDENNSSPKILSDEYKDENECVMVVPNENETNIDTTSLATKNNGIEVTDPDSGAIISETLVSESEKPEQTTNVSSPQVSDTDNKSNLLDSSPQQSSTPKKSKSSNRVRPGGKHIPFLGDDVKYKFQNENWSSYGKLANENSNSDAFKSTPDKPNKRRRDTRRTYSYTSERDFALLEELNSGKPRAMITNLDKYTVLLGKVREINLEASLRLKTRSGSDEAEKDLTKSSALMLDKGSMTEEDDFQPQGDVDFLASSFPGADISHLRETLAMCQGNVEWTLNLLLDWGVSEPFSSNEKEEICNEMKLKTITTPERTLKTPEFEHLRSPLSLFDICREHIEANNLADIDEMQKKLIKTSKQRLDRMESHSYERVHSISVSESSFSVDNDSILSDLASKSALSSDIYISPEKVVGDICDPATLLKGGQLFPPSPADQGGDWSLVDGWTEQERSMVDGDAHVMLPVPIDLVRDLEELFGPVQSSLSDCEEFEVSLDLRTAKRLFDNLRRKSESRKALERKRREEELAVEKQLKEDEALARKLQEEEDWSRRSQNSRQEVGNGSQLLREAKAAARNPANLSVHHTPSGAGLSVIDVRRKRETVNLMDIMEEERTNQQRREEKIRSMEGDRVAISTRLKRQKLTNQFPGMDENFLEEIFEANGYNLEDTVCVLQEAVGRGVSPRTRKLELSTPEREIKSSQEQPISRRNLQDLVEESWQSQGAGARYQSWDETGVPEYEDIRGEANIHHRLRNECFQKAQEAFRRGMKDVASFYSQQGHLHTVKLKEANKRASEKILEQRSATLMQQGTLDLHGFHVEEAISILNSVIQQREDEFQVRPDRRKQSLFVITGRGRHSKGGVAKLRPAIINHLNNTGYRYVEQPTGMFKIQLQYRA